MLIYLVLMYSDIKIVNNFKLLKNIGDQAGQIAYPMRIYTLSVNIFQNINTFFSVS